jgi:DNA-binding CsgD family transcriptional regulator
MHTLGGSRLATLRHVARMKQDDSARAERNAIRQALGDASPSLSNILDASTLGIAIYDEGLRCVLLNKALSQMNRSFGKAHVGETIRQTLGESASQVEPAFHHVWTTGKPLHDVELTVATAGRSEKTHFVLHFYPFRDNPGDMRLVGVLFYEVTNRRKLKERLHRLHERAEKTASGDGSLFGGESTELSARSIEMLQQSIEMIDCTMALRCQISEMRIVAALRRAAPFSEVPQVTQTIWNLGSVEPRFESDLQLKAESQGQTDTPTDSPSHREQQVIQLLVEGNSNKQVAGILNLSIRTVESYRARLMVKLHLHSVAELVRYAVRNNLIKA